MIKTDRSRRFELERRDAPIVREDKVLNAPERGTWYRYQNGVPNIICPACSEPSLLSNNLIYPDGSVEPAVHCAPCGAHYYAKLGRYVL